MKYRRKNASNVPEKANKILNGILIVLVLIAIKIWHLAIVQHDKKLDEAERPQRRIVIERTERATICDRFNIPLAINKVQYNATLVYGPIQNLPRWTWKKNEQGKRLKYFYRKEYIHKLCALLAKELNLDATRIEDLIHSRAALLGNVPCILKENISEEEYFRLKMFEKEWPGLLAEVTAKRCYPFGPIGSEVVGYLGPISRNEYEAITREMHNLKEMLSMYEAGASLEGFESIEAVAARLQELEKKAYHLNDFVGKMGIEATFDEELRGLCGKHLYQSDTRGNFLKKLPGSEEAVSGTQLTLALSAELQAFAQQLLAEYDAEPPSTLPAALKRRALLPDNQPWIKGGAIVALDPLSGEVYAMTSFPHFDPNDFIRGAGKNTKINQWLETERYLGQIWDMKIPLVRQRFDPLSKEYYEESIEMDWANYLNFILPQISAVKHILEAHATVGDALRVCNSLKELLALFEDPQYPLTVSKLIDCLYNAPETRSTGVLISLQERAFIESRSLEIQDKISHYKEKLAPYFSSLTSNYEKLLLADLYRLVVDEERFNAVLTSALNDFPLSTYREASAHIGSVTEAVRTIVKEVFLEQDFKRWRETHFKEYLAGKRQEEKEAQKKYARPYIEYLDAIQEELFQEFWLAHQWEFLLFFLKGHANPLEQSLKPYFEILKNWSDELHEGAHQGLDWARPYQRLCQLTEGLESIFFEFLKTLRSYAALNRPLLGKYPGIRGVKEKDLAAAFYPTYGFGFARSHAFRQATTIGSTFKLVPAYEALRQKYMAHQERGEALFDLNPLTIIDDKHRTLKKEGREEWVVGFTMDGRPIPMYYRGGRMPRSDHAGIGKVDIVKALENSSNPYFALLAGEVLEDPEDLCKAANLFGFGEKTGIELPGEYAGRIPLDVAYNRSGLYAMAIGQHSLVVTPLQTAVMLAAVANGGKVLKPQILKKEQEEVRWQVFMPAQVHSLLLAGLRQVVMGTKGTARDLRRHFDATLVSQMIGKTSTSEVIERVSLDGTYGVLKLKHVWFGGISYETSDYSKPELVVVVYLRYGEWGRDAAPLAMEVVKKWREIKNRASSF